jgi:hypothetical protein
MKEKINNLISLSEDLNNNLIDNTFEINLFKANLIINPQGENSNNTNENNSNLSAINISNIEINKLIQIFKLNKKTFKDFFIYKIFETREIAEILMILKEFNYEINQKIYKNLLEFSFKERNLVRKIL